MLPEDFLNRMKEMLKDEYPAFYESYEKERYQALRVNPLKADSKAFGASAPFSLTPVPWAQDGFYYTPEDAPGRHPYHEAGVYYIQEPSAMAPAQYLMLPLASEKADVVLNADEACGSADTGQPEAVGSRERILDLCAAPGGKSTQLAAAMQGRGILVCNEIHPARAKILSENIERMGICNAMVTNETPQRLAEHFTEYFTRILVDAPCSGEGMFRKNEEARQQWNPQNVKLCADRQDEILDCAASMLAQGGRLVYSTCTFAPEENEGSISRFLDRHPEFYIEEVTPAEGMSPGVPEWGMRKELSSTIRLWPHRLHGEGHYLALLRRKGELLNDSGYAAGGQEEGISARDMNTPGKGCAEYLEFAREAFTEAGRERFAYPSAAYVRFGEQLYLIPKGMPSVKGLKVLRPGLHLGTAKKGRFEPSHALALAAKEDEVLHTVRLDSDGSTIRDYLNGGTFPAEGQKGWYLVTADDYSTGWGKLAGGIMKNHYPKGLRRQL